MSTLVTVNIEIKSYLQKFLISKSKNKVIPLRFPNRHDYNILLIRLVTNYNSLKEIPVKDRENVLDFFHMSKQETTGKGVSIILPFNDRKNILSYNYLSVRAKQKFRKEVRIDFNFEFSRYLYRNLKAGKQRIEIVNEFKCLHNITEDDLKSESLYRYSSRLLEEM
jgi:hypothetical protein